MKDLTKGNIYKTFFLFGLPLVLSGLLSQAYQTIDTAIAGKFLGEDGLAAIGATSPLISFISSIFWGYGAGFCIYIAKLYGAGEYQKIKSAVYSNYLIFIVVCAVLSVGLLVFRDFVFDYLSVEESLRDEAWRYFSVYVGGLFLIVLSNNGLYLMNAFGISSYPFLMSLLSAVLNVAGNLVAVVVLDVGVAGLALASVLSAAVVTLLYVVKFQKCLKEVGADKERVKIGFAAIKDSFAYSVPNTVQQMIIYFPTFAVSPLLNGLGKAASASYSVVSRVYDICASVYQNSARCVSNYSAQCVGHGKCYRLKRGVLAGLLQGVLFVLPFIAVCSIFHKPVCSIFFKEGDSWEVKEYSYLFARRYLPFLFFNVICNLFHALYRGVKATGYLVTTTLSASVARTVLSFIMIPKMGMEGFFLAWVLSWVIEAVYSALLFFFGKWNPDKRALKAKTE